MYLSNSASDEFCILYIAQELYKMVENEEITDSLTVTIVLKAKILMLEGKI